MKLFCAGILVGFAEEVIEEDESINDTLVCVQVCEGILKRDAEVYLEFQDGTAQCKFNSR